MNAMSCQQVQEQIDLLAAGECDAALEAALLEHVHRCATCTARYTEAQRLVAMLDLQWSEAGMDRLRQRIEHEARAQRRQRRFPAFTRGLVAAAAILLVSAGLFGLLWNYDPGTTGPQLALLVHPERERLRIEIPLVPGRAPGPAPAKEKTEAMALPQPGGASLRQSLLQAQRDGKLPPPPAAALELVLVNSGKQHVDVHVDDAATLILHVQGPGVMRIPAPAAAETPALLQAARFKLAPGEQRVLRLDRLVAGSRGNLEYIYLTEPGEYTLMPRLELQVNGMPLTAVGEPVRLAVESPPSVHKPP
jgi:hypothetical protein